MQYKQTKLLFSLTQNMWKLLCCVLFMLSFVRDALASSQSYDICANNTEKRDRSCSSQIFGDKNTDILRCHIENYPSHSDECKNMSFSPLSASISNDIATVILRPYILPDPTPFSRAVVPIIISNIKFKTMKFRFQALGKLYLENHCGNISLSNNMTVNDQSTLYYNCYRPIIDLSFSEQKVFLDFEATDNNIMYRGQYYFKVPSAKMLKETVTEEEWLPFLYVELLTGTMKLHIVPPPPQLNITGYQIKIMKESDKGTYVDKEAVVNLVNKTHEVTYGYSLVSNGSFHFAVTPLHRKCVNGVGECQTVDSPPISITVDNMYIYVIIIIIVILAILLTSFAVYNYWSEKNKSYEDTKLLSEPKVLIVNTPTDRAHLEKVESFVSDLRNEGLDVTYADDITANTDPTIWAPKAYNKARYVINLVLPLKVSQSNNEAAITAYKNVDDIFVGIVKRNLVDHKSSKKFINVFFENSVTNKMYSEVLTNETRFHYPEEKDELITLCKTKRKRGTLCRCR